MKPQPFVINVTDEVCEDLRLRLQRTRWTYGAHDADWDYGASPEYLRELMSYWRYQYDWRRCEAELNAIPQFTADIDDARLHFLHKRGQGANPTPLLLLHGWPDSFYRYHKVIPRFASPTLYGGDVSDAFDVIVPSLPGFGFAGPVSSASTVRPNRKRAQLLWRLMTEVLGYERFAVAGGDGGSVLAQIVAIDHPESVIGIHLTDIGWHASNIDPAAVSGEERKYLESLKKEFMRDSAYVMVQSTKPASLAPSLNDSPSGLAAWIIDRFHSWCDCDGDIERSFTKDDLLTNIMIYWVTQTIGSSMDSYRAEMASPSLSTKEYVHVPVAMALFPKDIGGIPPRVLAERTLNVQRWTEMPRGSHFAALEEPELFANDVVEFFRTLTADAARMHHGGAHVSAAV